MIATSAPGALKILWREKVFLKPIDVKTIKAELAKRGYNFTHHNLLMALLCSEYLTRLGKSGSYTYIQKYDAKSIQQSIEVIESILPESLVQVL